MTIYDSYFFCLLVLLMVGRKPKVAPKVAKAPKPGVAKAPKPGVAKAKAKAKAKTTTKANEPSLAVTWMTGLSSRYPDRWCPRGHVYAFDLKAIPPRHACFKRTNPRLKEALKFAEAERVKQKKEGIRVQNKRFVGAAGEAALAGIQDLAKVTKRRKRVASQPMKASKTPSTASKNMTLDIAPPGKRKRKNNGNPNAGKSKNVPLDIAPLRKRKRNSVSVNTQNQKRRRPGSSSIESAVPMSVNVSRGSRGSWTEDNEAQSLQSLQEITAKKWRKKQSMYPRFDGTDASVPKAFIKPNNLMTKWSEEEFVRAGGRLIRRQRWEPQSHRCFGHFITRLLKRVSPKSVYACDTSLKPYQQSLEVVMHPKLQSSLGEQRMLVAHQLGSGKTRTIIDVLNNYYFDTRAKLLIFPTLALATNFYSELLKFENLYKQWLESQPSFRSIKEDYDKAVTEKQKEKLKVQMLTQAKELLMMKGLKIPKQETLFSSDGKTPVSLHAPLRAVSYTEAGGRFSQVLPLGGNKKPVSDGMFRLRGENGKPKVVRKSNKDRFNEMIVIMDEVHNLIEPGFAVTEDKKDRKEKVKACRDGIKTARGSVILGATATPIVSNVKQGDELLDVIMGDYAVQRKHPKDNYISWFMGRPSQVFAKVEGDFPDLRKIRPPDGYRTQRGVPEGVAQSVGNRKLKIGDPVIYNGVEWTVSRVDLPVSGENPTNAPAGANWIKVRKLVSTPFGLDVNKFDKYMQFRRTNRKGKVEYLLSRDSNFNEPIGVPLSEGIKGIRARWLTGQPRRNTIVQDPTKPNVKYRVISNKAFMNEKKSKMVVSTAPRVRRQTDKVEIEKPGVVEPGRMNRAIVSKSELSELTYPKQKATEATLKNIKIESEAIQPDNAKIKKALKLETSSLWEHSGWGVLKPSKTQDTLFEKPERVSPKAHAIVKHATESKQKTLILATKEQGLLHIVALLKQKFPGKNEDKLPFSVIFGGTKDPMNASGGSLTATQSSKINERRRLAFNSNDNIFGETKQILVADADQFSEGATFSNVRELILADVPRTSGLLDQRLGRVLRMCVHDALPVRDRTIRAYLYVAEDDRRPKLKTVDMSMYNKLIKEKESMDRAKCELAEQAFDRDYLEFRDGCASTHEKRKKCAKELYPESKSPTQWSKGESSAKSSAKSSSRSPMNISPPRVPMNTNSPYYSPIHVNLARYHLFSSKSPKGAQLVKQAKLKRNHSKDLRQQK